MATEIDKTGMPCVRNASKQLPWHDVAAAHRLWRQRRTEAGGRVAALAGMTASDLIFARSFVPPILRERRWRVPAFLGELHFDQPFGASPAIVVVLSTLAPASMLVSRLRRMGVVFARQARRLISADGMQSVVGVIMRGTRFDDGSGDLDGVLTVRPEDDELIRVNG